MTTELVRERGPLACSGRMPPLVAQGSRACSPYIPFARQRLFGRSTGRIAGVDVVAAGVRGKPKQGSNAGGVANCENHVTPMLQLAGVCNEAVKTTVHSRQSNDKHA